jgi:hypothetical protein
MMSPKVNELEYPALSNIGRMVPPIADTVA